MNAIELKNVKKSFGDFAIQDLTFSLPRGTICGLVGENGAGKSTTIRLLMGALEADSGSISVLGTDPASSAFRDTKEDIGVVLDDTFFHGSLDAALIGKLMEKTYKNWDQAAYEDFLDRFALPAKKRFKDYSRGMRMKLGIAVALSHHPKLLVLDEPTAGLDPIIRDEVIEIFRAFALESEDHAVLISSHILSDLEKLCDTIAFLHQGKLLFCEEKDRLLEECGVFIGTAAQAEELDEDAVIGREASGFGGVRMLVRRELVPAAIPLEKPTVEDIILFTVKGVNT
ncbi:MAG: ABC transporter ATP-binding protein [Oscillibacter sp.]|nr:ABC transporter ATP-binding protein [Oscillibacter sp.]